MHPIECKPGTSRLLTVTIPDRSNSLHHKNFLSGYKDKTNRYQTPVWSSFVQLQIKIQTRKFSIKRVVNGQKLLPQKDQCSGMNLLINAVFFLVGLITYSCFHARPLELNFVTCSDNVSKCCGIWYICFLQEKDRLHFFEARYFEVEIKFEKNLETVDVPLYGNNQQAGVSSVSPLSAQRQ